MAKTKALDSRLFEPGAYLKSGVRLVQVLHVRWTGSAPVKKRIVQVEDAYTEVLENLTDKEMEAYEFVCRGELLQSDLPTATAAG